ncbi:unnamed protein product [Acanthosepion pharaonis]|uniref:LEM domain-containing protein n=1 Tax=Acanthosepion pharaonis TaxID=158019 RepID=A0A812C873_ACAPH|nr:unnamed protein product [Sepia pharaonis]
MTNEDLATALKNLRVGVVPITNTTRVVYERKLARVPQDTAPAEFEEEEEEEEDILSGSLREEAISERLTSAYQRYTSRLASKISGGNNPPSYIETPGSSRLNTSLTRRPLSSMREIKFPILRNTQATSASSASDSKKKGMSSIIIKLFIMIIFGVIVWLIYMNFESPATKPLLNADH